MVIEIRMREVNPFEKIRKLLNSLSDYDMVAHVVKRVLQRGPTLATRYYSCIVL